MKFVQSVVALIAVALPTSAGVLYEVESSVGGTASKAVIAVDGLKMKMDVATANQDGNGYMIFDGDRREMIVVNHDDKIYFVIDHEQMQALSDQIGQAMASMEQALAALPESQRAKMEQMMKSRMPAMATPREPSELRKTGAADTVNGFDCRVYEVWRGGLRERELCVTDWDNVTGGREVAGLFYEMGEFMAEMLDSLPSFDDGGSIGDATYEHLRDMNGFPVRTREYGDDGMLDGVATLVSSTSAELDAADFEPPQKYKRRDLMKSKK